MSKTVILGVQCLLACAGVLAACGSGQSAGADLSQADIARVKDVRSSFGPQFQVTDVGPTGVDPKLLGPPTLPPGLKFDPAERFGATQVVPPS